MKQPTIQKSVLTVFTNNPFEALNHKQVAARLGVKDKAGKQQINDFIQELLSLGVISEQKRGKYKINPKHAAVDIPKHYVTGTVDMKQTGKAYVVVDNQEMDDIYIAPNNTNRAMHGDKVKVYLFPRRKARKQEGEIVEVLERSKKHLVGLLQINKNYAFVVPDNQNVPVDIFIPKDKLNKAKDGEKVLVEVLEWPERFNNPVGKILMVLGNPGDNDVEMQSILAEFEFPLFFPKEVETLADQIPLEISPKEIKNRRDFRDIFTCTIDPVDAKDFDDALSFRTLPNGHYEVGVHIADVTHYVKLNSPINEEAFLRGTSVYLVDRTIPMLPERLSNGVCSLRPNEDKLCYSVVFEMNAKAEVIDYWIGKTIINSDRRYAYEEAQEIIETGKGDFPEPILTLDKLAKKLRDKRFKAGAINFHSVEVRFKLDEKAHPIGVFIKESKEANHLIEEFMLLANRTVAEFIGNPPKLHGEKRTKKDKKTFVYRIHDEPNAEKLSTFLQFVAKLGYSMKISSRKALATSFNNLFEKVAGKGEENMVESIAIRTMAKAYYSTENIGHYGLAFPYYTHFTSPIRRYPDMMVHRLLERYMEGKSSVPQGDLEMRCEHASDMEKKATEAERASVKYKQAEFLKDKVGQTFSGVISGVSKWGLFVLLDDNYCEGMVSLKTLADDIYYLDDENYQVVGRSSKQTYKLGDKVRIKVTQVDLSKKRMDFVMV